MAFMAPIFYLVAGAIVTYLAMSPSGAVAFWNLICLNPEVAAVLFTALIAAAIAAWGIFSQRAISRRVYTLTYLSKNETDKDMIEARKNFIEISKNVSEFISAADPSKDADEVAKSIRIVLNDFELISIGIQRGVIDFETYKLWYKTGTINYWDRSKPFIEAIRTREKNPMLFHEFETLVGWLRDHKKPKRGYIVGHWFW